MPVHKTLAAGLLAFALGACAQLTAEQPLFSVADQGPPPLTEGVWIGVGEGCAEHNLRRRRFPSECTPLDIRRTEDGAWRVAVRVDLVSDLTATERAEADADSSNGPYRVIIAPAVERGVGAGYAPIYLAELDSLRDENTGVAYAIVAPLGPTPATEMLMAFMVGCDAILRDGPIDGIQPRYETHTDDEGESRVGLIGCVASSQGAVREAVRRAVIENLGGFTDRRYVFVRPN